ncbi:MAG TPA: nucleotidyl transferase AbiEii/AbiGii toxin family protein [Bacteriovoracaceae bacterium]|nr:nucleotidyl transferase AbiEii/AbiGii toxin family protein [Bacteriovoracaceae bacterium]
MIEKNEILEMATALGLSPDTVEKDYILGWLLYGININKTLEPSWLFKGGTSLKKCFFETFRFSEDLDFTISNAKHLNEQLLLQIFGNISDNLQEETGIEFFKDQFKFKIIDKGNGQFSAQGKIQYNGPLRRKQGFASIKLDLTSDEVIVLEAAKKKVHHPYSDEPAEGIFANCYAFEEVVAEKIRALGQRARPRDVYDVVHFFRNRELIKNPQLVYNTLLKKCEFKQIEVPTFLSVSEHEKIEELEPQWANMLEHQLPHLPPLESFWEDISPFFEWLYGALDEKNMVTTIKPGETPLRFGRISFGHIEPFLHKIQFSAASRVCVRMVYSGKERTIEPISFRTSNTGNRLFYGFEREANHVKAFAISEIQSLEISNLPYHEKYPVEINGSGTISMPPIRRPQSERSISITRSRTIRSGGPKYKYRCTVCDKIFTKKSQNSVLGDHKNRSGSKCYGRHGIFEGRS